MIVEEFRYVCAEHGVVAVRERGDLRPPPITCMCGRPLKFQLMSQSEAETRRRSELPEGIEEDPRIGV